MSRSLPCSRVCRFVWEKSRRTIILEESPYYPVLTNSKNRKELSTCSQPAFRVSGPVKQPEATHSARYLRLWDRKSHAPLPDPAATSLTSSRNRKSHAPRPALAARILAPVQRRRPPHPSLACCWRCLDLRSRRWLQPQVIQLKFCQELHF